MRQDARERISDIVYHEADNDGIIDEVCSLVVRREGDEVVDIGPSLAYMLMDTLRLQKGDSVILQVFVPNHPEAHVTTAERVEAAFPNRHDDAQ